MKTAFINTIAAAAFALVGAQAFAAEPTTGLTRAQVQAELARAKATGDRVNDITGLKENEMYPHLYANKAAAQPAVAQTAPTAVTPVAVQAAPAQGKTRAQVKAELEHAKLTGNRVHEVTGLKENQMYPHLYKQEGQTALGH